MHALKRHARTASFAALPFALTLLVAPVGHSTEVVFNGLSYFSAGEEWFVRYGGDTFRVAPRAIDIRFRDNISSVVADSIRADANVALMRSDRRGFHYLRLPEETDVLQKAMWFSALPGVELAETGFEIKFFSTPDDDSLACQWYLHNTGTVRGDTSATADADIDAPEAWSIETGDTTAIIAIIDTGIDRDHDDLSLSMWRNWDDDEFDNADNDSNGYVDDRWGWNFNEGNNNTMPQSGNQEAHGTRVAGVAGATTNDSIGIAGLAGGWGGTPRRSCLLMAIRCGVDDSDSLDISAAIDYADSNGARVINMSWGTVPTQCVSEALSDAYDNGVLLVAATAPRHEDSWPAEHEDVMGVCQTNWNDWYVDDYEGGEEIWAPGLEKSGHPSSAILTTDSSGHEAPGNYWWSGGTSLAAPQVAATGALLFSKNPDLTAPECRQLILAGADSLGAFGSITVARLNACGALEALCDTSRVDAHRSTVTLSDSSCVVFCPASDIDTLEVQITIRTGCGDPIAGVPADSITVSLLRNGAYNFRLCCGDSQYELNADAATDSDGYTTATIAAGAGVDPSVGVRVTALGVLLDDQPLADLRSVAYKGQCTVPRPEVGQVPDLDCDGTADDPGDHALVTAHYKHKCPTRGGADSPASEEALVGSFSASRAYPNPSSTTVAVAYELPHDTAFEVSVYSSTGQLVRTVERSYGEAGQYVARWDGLNERGDRVASGVYFVRVSVPDEVILRKVVILK